METKNHDPHAQPKVDRKIKHKHTYIHKHMVKYRDTRRRRQNVLKNRLASSTTINYINTKLADRKCNMMQKNSRKRLTPKTRNQYGDTKIECVEIQKIPINTKRRLWGGNKHYTRRATKMGRMD